MHYVLEPSDLCSGELTVPGDKSISHRALMLAAIAEGSSDIDGFLPGEDCVATLAALRAMGCRIEQQTDSRLSVEGVGINGLSSPPADLDLANSGTAMRLFAGLLSAQPFTSVLCGDASLSNRPMDRVIKPLTMMGANIVSNHGKPPLTIKPAGRLSGIVYSMPVASAQVKSAVLLAGLYANGVTAVVEPAVTRDHTERMLRQMGVDVSSGESQIMVAGGQQPRAADIRIPADLSSAAFIIVAALIAGNCELTITGVGVNSSRTGVLDILRSMGADISLENVRLYGEEPVADIIVRSSQLKGITVDPALASLAIDEFPLLFVAAACASGPTHFSGLGELRVKESDRISAMSAGLRNLGIEVHEKPDGARILGGQFTGGRIDSCGDHRVAMSFAVAGTVAAGEVCVENTAAVQTSFPGFADTLSEIGARIVESDSPLEAE